MRTTVTQEEVGGRPGCEEKSIVGGRGRESTCGRNSIKYLNWNFKFKGKFPPNELSA